MNSVKRLQEYMGLEQRAEEQQHGGREVSV